MELDKLYTRDAHDSGAELNVIGPDGKKTDFYILLVGVDSKKWREIRRKIERASLAKLADNKQEDINPAVAIADATIGWRGLKHNGEDVPFSYEAAVALYENAPYICEQADRFIAKRANFMKA